MKINYLNNGFEITYLNNKKSFITYQSIIKVSDVYIDIDDSNYDYYARKYTSDKVCKYAAFNIYLSNEQCIEIILDNGYKYFRRFDPTSVKKLFWLKRTFLFNSSNFLDKEAENWLKNKAFDMSDIFSKTKFLRDEFINHFNNWKVVKG